MSGCINFWSVFDIEKKRSQLEVLESKASIPGYWDNSRKAQGDMQSAAGLRTEIAELDMLVAKLRDAAEIASMNDPEFEKDLVREIGDIDAHMAKLEFSTLFNGEYDKESCILAIHAGTGGVDAMDWAEMLERMYLRWAGQHGFKTEYLDRSLGDEDGIKSVTIGIDGNLAYGYLRSERGVHRLVRLSPFDSAHRRHTSFALVEVWPDVHGEIDIQINPSDLEIDTYRSSGAGGQNVQKNETAIRIRHKPSGIVVTCQNERSLTQNRDSAMRVLRARLFEAEQAKQDAERADLKGGHIDANFGNQIRSYVLHPYQVVKDHRTEHEAGNSAAVLDGQLDEFMEAYLRWKPATS